MIIGVIGKKGSGKNAVGDILVKFWGFHQVAFGDALKAEVAEKHDLGHGQLYGTIEQKETVDPRHGKTPRRLMQEHGDLRRAEDPEYWVKALHETAVALRKVGVKHFVITDVRFQNEGAYVKGLRGHLWLIDRPGHGTGVEEQHASETEMETITPDVDIENTGSLADLRDSVLKFMGELSRKGFLEK